MNNIGSELRNFEFEIVERYKTSELIRDSMVKYSQTLTMNTTL